MYRRVSNNTKLTHFQSLGSRSIILHCWPATGIDVFPSATENRVITRDAHHSELMSPTGTGDTHSRHRGNSKAGLTFHLAPEHTTPLSMQVYGCKSLLTSQEGSHLSCKRCWGTTPALPPVPELSLLSPSHCKIHGNPFSQSLSTADKEASQTKTWGFTTRSPHQNILCIS